MNNDFVGSGSKVDEPAKIVKRGTAMVRVTDDKGGIHVCKLRNAAFVPSYRGRMLSYRRMEAAGHGLHFDGKGKRVLVLDGKHHINLVDRRGLYYLRCETLRRTHEQANAASATAALWHQRTAHSMDSIDNVKKRVDGVVVRGGCKHLPGVDMCQDCPVVKAHKQSKTKMPCQEGHATHPLERVLWDIYGPLPVGIGGVRFILGAVDEYTDHKMVAPMKAKSDVLPLIKAYNAQMGRYNTRGHGVNGMVIMKSDQDSVFKDKRVVEWLQEKGIATEYSATYTAWQVRKVERMWRTLGESARAMILTAGAEERLWPFAWRAAAYTLNRINESKDGKTAHELMTQRRPNVAHLRVFGSPAWVYIERRNGKLSDKAIKGMFVGYAPSSPAYLVLINGKDTPVESRNVEFDESPFLRVEPTVESIDDDDSDSDDAAGAPTSSSATAGADAAGATPALGAASASTSAATVASAAASSGASGSYVTRYGRTQKGAAWLNYTRPGESEIAYACRENCDNVLDANSDDDCVPNLEESSDDKSDDENDPKNYKDAMRSKLAHAWHDAMVEEYKALMERNTYELGVLPSGVKAVTAKWVFKTKRKADGSIDKLKARWVARGFTQVKGVNYDITFAPTARPTSFRVLVQKAINHAMCLRQLDVKSAFMNARLDNDDIWIEQPEGFVQFGSNGEKLHGRMKGSVNGLKQSGYCWNKELDTALHALGYIPTKHDPCFYVLRNENGEITVMLLVYVDDLIAAAKEDNKAGLAGLETLLMTLKEKYGVDDRGDREWYLGMHVERDATSIKIGQRQYVMDMLKKFGMENCNPAPTPATLAELTKEQSPDPGSAEAVKMKSIPYREFVGTALYLAGATRPDISSIVRQLSKFLGNPGPAHWQACKRLMRYLAGTADKKLHFYKGDKIELQAYCDADWAADRDARRSVTGYACFLSPGSAAVDWRSTGQHSVALSTMEAELMALAEVVKAVVHLRGLLAEIDEMQHGATLVHEDNTACIAVANNTTSSRRAKHIDLRYFYVRELVLNEVIKIVHSASVDMVADVLTKALMAELHEKHAATLFGKGH